MWAQRTPAGWVIGDPPDALADGTDLRRRDRALLAYLGWQPVDDTTARPADSEQGTWEPSVELVRGVVTLVWRPRPWTPDEIAARAAAAVAETVQDGDRAAARDLLDKLTADMGAAGDVWPTVKSWRALQALKSSDVTDLTGLARIVLWMVPASLRTARAARKALRLALGDTTPDTAGDQETA